MGLILDTSVLIKDEREEFKLADWLRTRPGEPIGISAITYSEVRYGIEAEKNSIRAKRRRRWFSKLSDEWKLSLSIPGPRWCTRGFGQRWLNRDK